MDRIIVEGGHPLCGEVEIGGSKNAALPILFAGILTGDTCVFSGLPRVGDVLRSLEILRALGARIRFAQNGDVCVNYAPVCPLLPPPALTCSIRGSTYLLGAMLGRFGKARLAGAGGCNFGARPIDQHLMGFRRLGAVVSEGDEVLLLANGGLSGCEITLAMPSVGATANLMLAAVCADGETVIRNAAAEPHVCALGEFLTAAGAHVEGIGTETVRVFGGSRLHGVSHTVIPDMIEAGTYLCFGAACGGKVTVKNVCPAHLTALLHTFAQMGIKTVSEKESITVTCQAKYRNTVVKTAPYPGFPTDLHPQLTALFAIGERATGVGVMREQIWSARFRYVEGLQKMGADIKICGDTATVTPTTLHAERLFSPDLRGGAALLLAALATRGESELTNAAQLARGYEHLGDKLRALGARIRVE